MTPKFSTKKGSVLVLTIVMSIFILLFSLNIMSTVTQQLKIFAIGRESIIALAAAESGIECAIYWTYEHPGAVRNVFASSSDSLLIPTPLFPPAEAMASLEVAGERRRFCAGLPINEVQTSPPEPNALAVEWEIVSSATDAVTTYVLPGFSDAYDTFSINNPCSVVSVARVGLDITIEAIGYNICDENYTQRVSRAIKVEFR